MSPPEGQVCTGVDGGWVGPPDKGVLDQESAVGQEG